ncbi:MAG: 16S rRNA (adenine(1518)-N(6)/adenine(1519)-N(6))-dimethyltransferase RsmA [Thermodesulfobacteriota bacterium]
MRPFARKRYGQHFLIDRNVVARIVRTAGVAPGDHVLEIGPGRGALTEQLLDAGARVLAIEVDPALAAGLFRQFPARKLEVVTADALKLSYTGLARERGCRFKVVSNLPYNISGPILAKFLDEREAFTSLVLMFQKEVAGRIAASPGTKEYGVLSVLSQTYTDVRAEFDVGAHLFVPRPKVTSSVVSFRVLDAPRVEVPDEAFFKSVVRAAFSTRRKMLPNALKTLGFDKETALRALGEAGVDPARRGETLSLEEFSALARALCGQRGA